MPRHVRRLALVLVAVVTSTAPAVALAEPNASGASSPTRWNSVPLAATGAAVTGVGVLVGGTGVVLSAVEPSRSCRRASSDGIMCQEGLENPIGHLLLAAGLAHVATGVPRFVAGAWSVPTHDRPDAHLRIDPTRVELDVRF
jgi:hypothetical protein